LDGLGKTWRTEVSATGARGDAQTIEHVPSLRCDIAAILAIPLEAMHRPAHWREARQVKAAWLAAIDSGLTTGRLAEVRIAEIKTLDGGDVMFAGCRLTCDHEPRAVGVPWDCSACAVRDVLRGRSPDERFVTASSSSLSTKMMKVRDGWSGFDRLPGCRPGTTAVVLQPKQDLSLYALAGLRRGIVVVEAGPVSSSWLVGRPWTAVTWEAGLRMASDLESLPRSAVEPTIAGDGFVLHLAGTKDDPTARKEVTRVFLHTDGLSAAGVLAEYLAVRDAAVGSGGPLLIATPGRPFARRSSGASLAHPRMNEGMLGGMRFTSTS
jgi:hypothetical protein